MKPWPSCVLVLFLGACSAGQDEAGGANADAPPPASAPRPPSPAVTTADSAQRAPSTAAAASPYQRSFSDPFVQHAYKAGVNGCFYYPPALLAEQFDVSNDREAIARAYSMLTEAGQRRDAAYVGCLEGLAAPAAGQRKQFSK